VGSFPEDRIFTWSEVEKPLNQHRYVLMHSVTYRTELLRECGIVLPEHMFYVDNLMAFTPFLYVRTLYYLNVPLYRYFIGREDQSVNEEIMINRIDQQIRITKMMIDAYRPDLVRDKNQADFLVHYLYIIMTITSVLLLRMDTPESLAMKKDVWDYLKKKDLFMFLKIRRSLFGRVMNVKRKTSRDLVVKGYRLTQKFYGFN
jgi:hypothetical protein